MESLSIYKTLELIKVTSNVISPQKTTGKLVKAFGSEDFYTFRFQRYFSLLALNYLLFYQVHPEYMQEARLNAAEQQVLQSGISPENDAYMQQVEEKASTLTNKDIGDKIFPHFIGRMLPSGITGLLIAAIFAAAMSTISTSLNSSATLLTTDWYQRFINRQATEKQSLKIIYTATIIWGILGTGVALLLVNVSSALDAWWTLAGILSGGMLGLFLLGMISKKATNPIAAISVALGFFVISWMTLSPKIPLWLDKIGVSDKITEMAQSYQSQFHSLLIPVFGTVTILLRVSCYVR